MLTAQNPKDPRPPPKCTRRPRTSPILPCEVCGTGFVSVKGNANRFCSYACCMSVSFWNDQTIADLRLLWREGHTIAEIGRRLGCSERAITGKVRRTPDLERRPNPVKRRQ